MHIFIVWPIGQITNFGWSWNLLEGDVTNTTTAVLEDKKILIVTFLTGFQITSEGTTQRTLAGRIGLEIITLCLTLSFVFQRKLVLQNQYSCSMHFSTPKNPQDKQLLKTDWTCSKVGWLKRMIVKFCFKVCDSLNWLVGLSQTVNQNIHRPDK